MALIPKKTYSRRKDDNTHFSVITNDSDPFDKLLSSPLKQDVNFLPLSFWANKSHEKNLANISKSKKEQLNKLNESEDSSSDSSNIRKSKSKWKIFKTKTAKRELRKKSVQQTNTYANTTSQYQEIDSRLCQNIRKDSLSDKNDVFSCSSNQRNSFQFVTFRRGFKKNLFEQLFTSENNNPSDIHKICMQENTGKLNENSNIECSDLYKTFTIQKRLMRRFNEFDTALRNITNDNNSLATQDPKTNYPNLWFESQNKQYYFKGADKKSKKNWNNSENLIPDSNDHKIKNRKPIKQEVLQHCEQVIQELSASNLTKSDETDSECSLLKDDENCEHLSETNLSPCVSTLVNTVSDETIKYISPTNSPSKTMQESVETTVVVPNSRAERSSNNSTIKGVEIKKSKPLAYSLRNITTRRCFINSIQNKLYLSPMNNKTHSENQSYVPEEESINTSNLSEILIPKSYDDKESNATIKLHENFENKFSNSSIFSCLANPMFESTRIQENTFVNGTYCQEKTVALKPGKKWLRCISVLRQLQNDWDTSNCNQNKIVKGKHYNSFVRELCEMQPADLSQSDNLSCSKSFFCESHIRNSSASNSFSPVSQKICEQEIQATNTISDMSATFIRKKKILNHTVKIMNPESFLAATHDFRTMLECQTDVTVIESEGGKESFLKRDIEISAKDIVLRHCGQKEVLPFEEHFNEKTLKGCKKIGEGVFGEVFMSDKDTVIKVIPIEGNQEVNGEPQKKFGEILSEVIITSKLSDLRQKSRNQTCGFSKMKRCWCVFGKYPKILLDLWEEFNASGAGSENDSPEMFKSDQEYIVLEMENGGKCLESFIFNSAEQSLSVFIQTAFTLAVAEKAFEFEHRDLHWGNILIKRTKEKYMKIVLDGTQYSIPTKGVKVSVIDFTLSRILHEECCLFNDLSHDPTLFASQGDYQFEIYRMMLQEVGNDWSLFKPKNNVFWLHYTLDKMIKMVRYKNKNTHVHKKFLKELRILESIILQYDSCYDFVKNTDLV